MFDARCCWHRREVHLVLHIQMDRGPTELPVDLADVVEVNWQCRPSSALFRAPRSAKAHSLLIYATKGARFRSVGWWLVIHVILRRELLVLL